MTTDIMLLRSSVASKRPAVSPLLEGQAAVNINPAEPGLFFKDSGGADLIKIGPVAVNTSGDAPNANPAGSVGNSVGETWVDGRASLANSTMKVWDGSAWSPSNGFAVDDTTGEFTLDRLMTVRTLESDGTGANSYLRVPQDTTTARAAIAANEGMIRFNTTLLAFEGYDGSDWSVFALSQSNTLLNDLTVYGDTILGDDCAEDTLTINSITSINCDTTIGASSTNTLSVVSVVASDLIPDATDTRTLGSATARWNAFTNDFSAIGNTVLGDDDSVDTVTVTATLTQNGTTEFLNDATIWGGQQMRFSSVPTPNPAAPYVSFQPPATLAASVNFVLPDADGANGESLVTDGSGNLSWANATFGSGGDLIIGDGCSSGTFVVNSTTSINCDMVIGTTSAEFLAILSGITSNVIPSVDNTVNLGSSSTGWANIYVSNDILPVVDNVSNLGTASQRFANLYTGDLHLKNDRGDWTMIEEEDYLSLRNNKSGKTFKIVTEEI